MKQWDCFFSPPSICSSVSDPVFLCPSYSVTFFSVFSLAPTNILYKVHMTTHIHRDKCQGGSPPCCPQVMHAWHFVKMTAEESHHKLLLTEAASPVAPHESHCNFSYPSSLPGTRLSVIAANAENWWLSAGMLHALMFNRVQASACMLFSGFVSLERTSKHDRCQI